jgi:glycosyltransferase involved in cell wall biosynthesis
MIWHVLDGSSIWIKEFASALGKFVPVRVWAPEMSSSGLWRREEWEEILQDPPLRIRRFPLQRGYSRFPISWLTQLGPRLSARLSRECDDAVQTPLICTNPYYAPVAEQWPGPVIYYLTDLTVAYDGASPRLVRSLDRRMCRIAEVLCPNSRRIADYLISDCGADASKIRILPNATRALNVPPEPRMEPAPVPQAIAGMPRPIAGVIGNLAANMDWLFLLETIRGTKQFSWVFVGPTEMPIADAGQRRARNAILEHGGRVRFTGRKPYPMLQDYARAFDVAVLPYRCKEPTYSGSSTRFYEHLAAGRPMLATRGFEELLHKEPLLRLVDTPEQAIGALEELRKRGFRDGQEQSRWEASRAGTWETRALEMIRAATARRKA